MKRLWLVLLALTMIFNLCSACRATAPTTSSETETHSSQQNIIESINPENATIADYIIREDEDVFLVLPKSKDTLDLHAFQERLDQIDLDLLKNAEDNLLKTIANYPDPYESVSEFYLQTDDDGYLCLAVELIVIIDPPTENGRGCGIDHDHKFILERISK